jgi:hypothetical protein
MNMNLEDRNLDREIDRLKDREIDRLKEREMEWLKERVMELWRMEREDRGFRDQQPRENKE